MTILVRPASHSDLDDLCALLQQLFAIEQDFRPDRDRQIRGLRGVLEREDAVVLVACEHAGPRDDPHAGPLGMITVQVMVSTAEGGLVGVVEDVVVRQQYRKQGIGARLLDSAEDWARQRGLSRLQLLADRDNVGAQRFYDRTGWQPTSLVARRRHLQ